MNPKTYLAVGCMVLLGLSSCRTSAEVIDRSQFLADQHNFHQAYWIVSDALDEHPEDPELERVFWARRLEYLLDRGQQLVFLEQEKAAIAEFQKVLALDPGNRVATVWINRSLGKLADQALRLAETLRHEGNLQGALKLYNKALAYVPEIKAAIKGIEGVNERYQARTDKSNEHYLLGARARGEQKFRQSHYHSGIAEEFDKSNEKAKKLRVSVGKRLAYELLEKARASEVKGFYAAAFHDYEAVKVDLPDTKGIDERIAAMRREVEVRELCQVAEMLTRKSKFDEAGEMLTKAFKLSQTEKGTVSGQMLDNKRYRYDDLYQKAKDQELEHQYESALEAFKEIDKAWPSRGFLDVKTRISGLESQIKEAELSFAAGVAAEKAGKFKEALEHFEDAVLVYPGYKNLEARIRQLKARSG